MADGSTVNVRVKFTTDGAGNLQASVVGLGDAAKTTGTKMQQAGEKTSWWRGQLEQLKVAVKANAAELFLLQGGAIGLATTLTGEASNAIKEFARSTVETIAAYQSLRVTLNTVEGSAEKAARTFGALRDWAARTPYQLQDATHAWVQLRAQGLEPSLQLMTALGNIASGMDKSLDQITQAVLDAAQGEFERLKEFGVKARVEGDHLVFTWKGVQTEVEYSSNAIVGYLQNIGETDFAGLMEAQSETLGGSISNLQDAIDGLKNAIGEAGLNGVLVNTVHLLTKMVELADELTVKLRNPALTGMLQLFNAMQGNGIGARALRGLTGADMTPPDPGYRGMGDLRSEDREAGLDKHTTPRALVTAADDLKKALRTPVEEYQQNVADLKRMRREDLIDDATYTRALAKYAKDRDDALQKMAPKPPKGLEPIGPPVPWNLSKEGRKALQDNADKEADAAQKAWNKDLDLAAQLIDKVRTPFQQLRADLADYTRLLDEGLLTQDQYNDAVKSAGDAYTKALAQQEKALRRQRGLYEEAAEGFQGVIQQWTQGSIRGLGGILRAFYQVLTQMVLAAAAARLTDALFGSVGAGGARSGGALGFLLNLGANAAGAAIGASSGFHPTAADRSAHWVHDGGIVGTAPLRRLPRFHDGGLATDEVPAILQRNEEVLTTRDPRHTFNGGRGTRVTVMLPIATPDADSFRRSEAQVGARLARELSYKMGGAA